MSVLAANAAYVPLQIFSGLNADVVANGVGNANVTATADVDGANFCFVAMGWQQTSTSTPLSYGLPANGVINSAATAGLTFNMSPFTAPYSGNNSLRIPVTGNSGTLTFVNNPKATTLYLLATSGSGTSYFTGQINFTDATNQPITTQTIVPDWFNSSLQPVAVSGFGRLGFLSNIGENPAGNPRLYQIAIPILAANQTKQIASIQITKSSMSDAGAVLNVMGVSVDMPVTCAAPTAPTAGSITGTSAQLNWTHPGSPLTWQIKYGAPNFNPNTAGTSIFTTSKPYTLNPPLASSTAYEYYVRAVCAAGDTSLWSPVYAFTTTCNAPSVASRKDSFRCGSGPVTLEATSSAGGSIKWYQNLTGGTALATGTSFTTPSITANTTYYVSAVSGTCESTPRLPVIASVRTVPTVNIGNDTTICPGVTYTLNATTTGASSYAWNTGATTASINVTNAGTYSVLVTVNGCGGSDARVITAGIVPVNNLPATTNLCEGETASLNAGNTGSTFLWTPGGNTTQIVNVTAGGTHSVAIKSVHGCVINSATNVMIRPLPVASLGNDTSICEGAQIILNAGNAGYSFDWNTGAATQTINVTDSGTYEVTITTPYNCTLTEDKHVAFLPAPRVEGFNFIPMFYEDLGKVKFSALNPTDVNTYEWDFGDGSAVSNQVSPTHIYAGSGQFIVTLKVFNDCSDYMVEQPINVNLTTGIDAPGRYQAQVMLWPNPAGNVVSIANGSTDMGMQDITVFNSLGAVVYRAKADSDRKHSFSVAGLSSGIYSVRIGTDKGTVIRKLEVLR